jgi:hypothetical protein
MPIPSSFNIGRSTYLVDVVPALPHRRLGYVSYTRQRVYIARMDSKWKDVPPREMADTFWHEVTHAVLHDMNMPKLRDDETFVIEFAKRITQVVHSAEF